MINNKNLIKFAKDDKSKSFLDNDILRDSTFSVATGLTLGSLSAYIAAKRAEKKGKNKLKAALKWGLPTAVIGSLTGLGASKAVATARAVDKIRNDNNMVNLLRLGLKNMKPGPNGEQPLIPSNMLIRGLVKGALPIAWVGDRVTEGFDSIGSLFSSNKNDVSKNGTTAETIFKNPYVLSSSGAGVVGSLSAYIAAKRAEKKGKNKLKAALKWGLAGSTIGGLSGYGLSEALNHSNDIKSNTKSDKSNSNNSSNIAERIYRNLNNGAKYVVNAASDGAKSIANGAVDATDTIYKKGLKPAGNGVVDGADYIYQEALKPVGKGVSDGIVDGADYIYKEGVKPIGNLGKKFINLINPF